MENNGNILISRRYTRNKYLNLKLSTTSNADDWKKAIDIFHDRISGRYMNPISSLLKDVVTNGFVIMAIECLIIETLIQFRDGIDELKRRHNREDYSNFLKDEFSTVFDEDTAVRFYEGIRCGILHSSQIKKDTRLTTSEKYVIKLENDILYVSVERLLFELNNYIENYENELQNPNNETLRENFIKKMDLICKKDII